MFYTRFTCLTIFIQFTLSVCSGANPIQDRPVRLWQPTGGLKRSSLQLGLRVGGHLALTDCCPDDPKWTLAYGWRHRDSTINIVLGIIIITIILGGVRRGIQKPYGADNDTNYCNKPSAAAICILVITQTCIRQLKTVLSSNTCAVLIHLLIRGVARYLFFFFGGGVWNVGQRGRLQTAKVQCNVTGDCRIAGMNCKSGYEEEQIRLYLRAYAPLTKITHGQWRIQRGR